MITVAGEKQSSIAYVGAGPRVKLAIDTYLPNN